MGSTLVSITANVKAAGYAWNFAVKTDMPKSLKSWYRNSEAHMNRFECVAKQTHANNIGPAPSRALRVHLTDIY